MSNDVQYSFRRVEKKYLLTASQYERLVKGIRNRVRQDDYDSYTVCNVYYDTDDFRLIRASLEKPVYKEKLRLRSYGVPGDGDKVFVELKKKFDGVVYKRRVVMEARAAVRYLNDGCPPQPENQICHEIDWFLRSYRPGPKVLIAYEREAYAGLEQPDLRITFDRRLRWRDTEVDLRLGSYGAPILGPEQVLMELKIPGAAPLWLARLLSETEAFPTSFSKYGTCYQQNLLLGRAPHAPLEKEIRAYA